jgi:MFS superfamily sulfate permease-like transporter
MNDHLLSNTEEEIDEYHEVKTSMCSSCSLPSPLSFITVMDWFPKRDTKRDFISGITVGCMAVPQAMSYATVAGLPAQYGLFNAFMGLLPYPIFGTSPHLISGPTAVMSILVAGLIPTSIEIPDLNVPDGYRHLQLTCAGPEGSLTGPDSEGCQYRIAVALSLSFLAALVQLCLGLLKLGYLVDLVSEPIIVGFTTGSAFLIASTQFTSILGIGKAKHGEAWGCKDGFLGDGFQGKVCNVIHELVDGKGSWQTMVLGAFCILILYLFKYQLRPRLPKRWTLFGNLGPITVMFIMIPWMAATNGHVFGGDIKLVGSVCKLKHPGNLFHPECLPRPRWPLSVTDLNATSSLTLLTNTTGGDGSTSSGGRVFSIFSFSATTFGNLLGKAIAVAMIGYMESMTIAKTVARTSSEETGVPIRIDPSKELVALGVCNLVCSQMSGYPVTGSFSRTAVNADSGAQTQFAAMFAAMLVGAALLMLTPVLQYIPKLALSAIVLIAILKLIKLHEAIFLWHVKRRDFLVFASVVFITVFLGVEAALVVGILESWLLLLSNTNRAHAMVLGHAPQNHAQGDRSSAQQHSHERKLTPSNYQIVDVVEQVSANAASVGEKTSLNSTARMAALPDSRVALIRVFNDLSFASAASFREMVVETVEASDPAVVVVDASSVNDVDGSGFYALMDISSFLARRETKLFFAAMPLHARKVIAKAIKYSKNTEWDLRLRKQANSTTDTSSPLVQFYATRKVAVHAARLTMLNSSSRPTKMVFENDPNSSVEFKSWED